MKKTHLILPLFLAAAATFTACSDDNDITKPTQPTAEEVDQAQTAKLYAINHIIRPLAGLDALPDNWETAIFTPTEGVVTDEANPEVRSVIATDLAGAEQYFQDLCPDLDEGATTWSNDSVGSLKFTKVGTDQCFATIDVDLKQMPGLKQIRLVPENVIPANSKFDGTPYYNMGDIVKDKKGIYWICVRPSGGPLKKDQSYFVSFDKSLLKLKTQNQDIYEVEKNDKGVGAKTKTKTSTSGTWTYATNLVDEKIAIAAAHTFATIAYSDAFSEHNSSLDLTLLYQHLKSNGYDFRKLVNYYQDDDGNGEHRMVFVAYGSYKSGNSKFVQEAKIQPLLGLDLRSYDREEISTYNYLDSKNVKDWEPMSLTVAHSELINTLMRGWNGKSKDGVGYPTPYNVSDYTIKMDGKGFDFSGTKYYNCRKEMPSIAVLVLTQKKITDKGQASKEFEVVVKSPFSTYENNDFYYATLAPRYIYDKSHDLKKGPNVVKQPQE